MDANKIDVLTDAERYQCIVSTRSTKKVLGNSTYWRSTQLNSHLVYMSAFHLSGWSRWRCNIFRQSDTFHSEQYINIISF